MLSEEEKYFHKTNTARLEVVPSFLYEQMNNEGDAHHSDMTRPLYKAIANLPSKSRQAIKLRYLDNLAISIAAKTAGCSCDAFRKRLYRAKNRLRDMLNYLKE